MHAETKRSRGRPPAQVSETREALLQAAQRLFTHCNFRQVGSREIAEEANVAVGSINYHFGSKEGLLEVLCERVTPALLEERLARLQLVLLQAGSREDRIKAVLRALIEPVVRWSRRPETQLFFAPFMMQVRKDGPQRIRELMRMEVDGLRPFQEVLRALMPQLTDTELGWRLHFALAVEHALSADTERLRSLTAGAVDLDRVDDMVEHAVQFLMHGGFS